MLDKCSESMLGIRQHKCNHGIVLSVIYKMANLQTLDLLNVELFNAILGKISQTIYDL